jgi:DNA-binding CsgD family transcriptional regulator
VTATTTSEREGRRLEPQLIERPRLLEKLDGSDARVIALIAPAGFGKTTLARQWISSRKIAGAWYSVGSEGFDIAAVAARIAAVVSTVVSGAGERMLTRLSVSTDPEAEAVLLAEMLSKELAAWPADARFVIDDYQALAVSHACERFIGTLVRETPLRLLITSRKRPSWASSRLRLYGELLELRRDQLEMTPKEAAKVLSPIASEAQRAELVQVCRGWPAILGLAARSQGSTLPKNALLRSLYDYFAEELYQDTSPELERFLCQIAAAPNVSKNLLERLGPPAFELAADAERSGFLHSAGEDGERSLHPLLRSFLEQRLEERSDRIELMDELAAALIADERWDDVWRVIHDRDRPDLLPRLIELSLPTLLDGSRIAALESWVEFGRERKLISPLLDLAEAEVAFVVGDLAKAYALAIQSTHHFDEASPLCWRAHAVAGRSAHLSSRQDAARRHMAVAQALAPDHSAVLHCLWTDFLSAIELESEDMSSLVDRLFQYQDGRPESFVRAFSAHVLLSAQLRHSPLLRQPRFEDAASILSRVHPQVRTCFEVVYCDYLTQAARYSEADTVIRDTWNCINDYGLSFGIPTTLCARATIAIGLRRYRHALLLLDVAERQSDQCDVRTYVAALRILINTISHDVDDNALMLEHELPGPKSWQGMALSVNALSCASRGKLEAATEWASHAERATRNTDTHALTALVRTVVAERSGSPDTHALFASAIAFIDNYQRWNALVWAYRACPELLALGASDPAIASRIAPVLNAALDKGLAAKFGIELPAGSTLSALPDDALSRREREVLQLAADGLPNKEISKKLFISEVTVKVHLRHIYRKLGVRNRTEAACYAVYSD